jgi:hypothetical protein
MRGARRIVAAGLTSAIFLGLAGCSSSHSAALAAPGSPGAVSGTTSLDYVSLIADEDPRAEKVLLSLTAPGSPAYFYGLFVLGQSVSVLAMGGQLNPHRAHAQGGSVLLCPRPTAGQATVKCVPFSNFRGDSSGRIVSFSISGQPVDGRSVIGTGAHVPVPFGGYVRLTAAVASASLVAIIHLAAGSKGLDLVSVQYVTSSGQKVTPEAVTSPPALPPGKQTEMAAAFRAAPRGGTIILTVRPYSGGASSTVGIRVI